MSEVESMSFVAIGRRHGVSDNAVRKWICWYEHQAAREGRSGEEKMRGDPSEQAA